MSDLEIHSYDQGNLRVIRLNRGKALNALNMPMLEQLEQLLDGAEENASIKSIWLESAVPRVFCAGGDVKALVQAAIDIAPAAGRRQAALSYFELEYRVDAKLAACQKPLVCFADGLTLGGGWGLFAGGHLRLATEPSQFAMPENQIGFYPDVGAASFLQAKDWKQGMIAGLSGMRLSVHDMLACDWLDAVIDDTYAETLKQQLAQGLLPSDLDIPLAGPELSAHVAAWEAAADALPEDGLLTDWLEIWRTSSGLTVLDRADRAIEEASPWSLAFTWHMFEKYRKVSRQQLLPEEAVIASRHLDFPDFIEGVRARLIDKSGPADWHFQSVEAVPKTAIDAVLNGEQNL